MQKVAILVAVVLALGVSGWYFLSNDATDEARTQEDTESTQSAENTQDESFSGFGSIAELVRRGDSFVCEFRTESEGAISEGTAYIDGPSERYRMDATYQDASESGSFNAIVADQMMYWWGDTPEGRVGMRMSLPEEEAATAAPPESFGSEAAVSAQEDVEYECDPWRVDVSAFTPPSDVEFTDMDAMMEEMMQGMPEGFEEMQRMGQ